MGSDGVGRTKGCKSKLANSTKLQLKLQTAGLNHSITGTARPHERRLRSSLCAAVRAVDATPHANVVGDRSTEAAACRAIAAMKTVSTRHHVNVVRTARSWALSAPRPVHAVRVSSENAQQTDLDLRTRKGRMKNADDVHLMEVPALGVALQESSDWVGRDADVERTRSLSANYLLAMLKPLSLGAWPCVWKTEKHVRAPGPKKNRSRHDVQHQRRCRRWSSKTSSRSVLVQVRSAGQVRFAVGLDVGTSGSVKSVTSEVGAPNNTAPSGVRGWKAE